MSHVIQRVVVSVLIRASCIQTYERL